MRTSLLLLVAAALEVGGDALIRHGLKGGGVPLILLGAAVLVGYGLTVNLTSLDFGRLMGLYIVMFFVVAQLTSVLIFREKLNWAMWTGGLLVIGGGLTMACWRS